MFRFNFGISFIVFEREEKKKKSQANRKAEAEQKQQDRLIKKSKIRIADEETKSERKIFCY